MAKYDVIVDVYASYHEEVEANSQEEAEQKMWNAIDLGDPGIYDRIRGNMDFFELVVRGEED